MSKSLRKEQDDVMGQVAKHLLGPARYKAVVTKARKALGIQGSIVARPELDDEEEDGDGEEAAMRKDRDALLEKALAKLAAVEEMVTRQPPASDPKAVYDDVRKMMEGK